MKKLFLAVVCLLINAAYSNAQVDTKAQQILKEVSAKYKSYKSLSASFKLNLMDQKTKKAEVQNGSITLKGNMFNLTMADQVVMSDGKLTWTYLKESNEVQISEAKTSSDAISPTNIFTMYEHGYKQKYLADKKNYQLIELFPDDAKKNYFKIQLEINKKDKYVQTARVYDKNGNIYTYSIVKFIPNATVTDDMFTFNKSKYPGVEVVDLR